MTLTDTQAILLSAASQRDSASLYPLPATITTKPGPLAKSIGALRTRGLIEEHETSAADEVARTDGDLRFGLFITTAGKTALGIDDGDEADGGQDIVPSPAAGDAATDAAPRQTKAALVLSLLQRDGGASLDELVDATGWLPHTTRAALTGLRKKGHEVGKAKVDGVTRYSVVAA